MNLIISRFVLCISFLLATYPSHGYVPISTDSRIKTLIYSPNEIFYLTFNYNFQSYIEFPEDERVNIITLGDRYSWNIKKVGQRLFIKPYQKGVSTNMTIITDKRQYHFEIHSSVEESGFVNPKLAFVVKFFYPDTVYDYMNSVKIRKPIKVIDKKRFSKEESEPIASFLPDPVMSVPNLVVDAPPVHMEAALVVEPARSIDDDMALASEGPPRNYRYSMAGDNNSTIKPFMVYDDGISTYFSFNSNILPDIFYVDQNGSETLVDFKIINNQIVVNNTAWQYSLRNNKEVICIFNDNIIGVTY